MQQWTTEQQAAIYDRNSTMLVSAAAGSGKTAVLIERIYSLITLEKTNVDRMLVVTFTRAAAAEMRERLHHRLQKEAETSLHIRNQLNLLDQASIGTLHGFCGQVLREFFYLIQLDLTARLFQGGERDALINKALAITFENAYEKGSPAFAAFAARYTDPDMIQMVTSLYHFLMAQANPWEWLSKTIVNLPNEETLFNHPWMTSICQDLLAQAKGLTFLAKDMVAWCKEEEAIDYCKEVAAQDLLVSQSIEKLLTNPDSTLWDFQSKDFILSLTKVPRKKTAQEAQWYLTYKDLKRSPWKKILLKIENQLPKNLKQTLADVENTRLALAGLQELLLDFHQHFSALKEDLNVYDYQDLEHKTLAVLNHPEGKLALENRFDAIFVDEYQDTSGIQEAILQALHQNNLLFMVGDVKQSIYRFRLADPTLFLKKQTTFSTDEKSPERKIDLQKNFRSAADILYGINQVFENVMTKEVTEIDYDENAKLIPGLEAGPSSPITLAVNFSKFSNQNLPTNEGEEEEEEDEETLLLKEEEEAHIIADYFLSLQGKTLLDKGSTRFISWKDMVILTPKAKGVTKKVADVFQEKGIPLYSDADEEYFSLPEIDTIMAFLEVIDNPLQDLPLLRMLKVFPFSFTEEELAQVRLFLPDKNTFFHQSFFALTKEDTPLGIRCYKTWEQIERWQKQVHLMPLDQFIWQLLWDSNLYITCGAMAAGEVRQGNLRLLCQTAYEFATSQFGTLHDFILLTQSLSTGDDIQTAKTLGENEDVVRIMTIHKSKGLEFPVVAVMGLGNSMHMRMGSGDLQYHKDLGLALSYMNVDAKIKRKTLGQQAITLRKRAEETAERARLLYVAMTRARNHLFLVGTPAYKNNIETWSFPPGPYRVAQAGSMLDWLCQTVFSFEESAPLKNILKENFVFSPSYSHGENPWNIKVFENPSLEAVEIYKDIHRAVDSLLQDAHKPINPYPFYDPPPSLKEPLKTSVTSLVKENIFKQEYIPQEEETFATKREGETLLSPLTLSPLPALPTFMAEDETTALTPAQKGTLTHKVLGLVDLTTIKGLKGSLLFKELENQLNTLESRGVFTKEEKEGVFLPWIQGFFESPLGEKLLKSAKVHREWPFIYKMPGTKTLVQGVIDCCFLYDNEFILLDYKTDYVKDINTVKQRYQGQISLYKQALEDITKTPVKSSYIYLLRKGETITF